MTEFYIKNKAGSYLPIDIKSIFSKEMNNKLVILRIGSDEHRADAKDLDETEESLRKADVLNGLDNISIVITPYQIDVSIEPKEELENKSIFVQITSGSDVAMLDDRVRKIYNGIKNKYETSVVPTPLTVAEYRKVCDVVKRCEVRRERRNKAK